MLAAAPRHEASVRPGASGFTSLSRATVVGLFAFVAILAGGAIDHTISHDRYVELLSTPSPCSDQFLPPAGAPTQAIPPESCQQAGITSYQRASDIEGDSQDHARLYLVGLAAAVAFITFAALRKRPSNRARIFNNLGIAGVCVLVATALATTYGGSEPPDLPGIEPWLLSFGMIGVGIVGRLTSLRDVAADPTAWRSWQVLGALVISAVDVAAAWAFSASQPECGGAEQVASVPEFAFPVFLAGVVLGVACLATRHWVAALVAIVANPFAYLIYAAASCAFY